MSTPVNDVRAFRGLVYDPAKVGDPGLCLSQPYDVIDDRAQRIYYDRHPQNIIRLILDRVRETDSEADNRYLRARKTYRAWRKDGVLRQTDTPCLWAYRQQYRIDGIDRSLTGVIALVRLHEFAERRVLPHEKVMPRTVEDRIRLTLSTHCQLEPIWSFYNAPGARPVGDLVGKREPFLSFDEPETGVRHIAWRIDDPDAVNEVTTAASSSAIYIADGHHRYNTMLRVRQKMIADQSGSADAPWNFMMMLLVNASRERQTVLPYHRVVRRVDLTSAEVLRRVERDFEVERHDNDDGWLKSLWRGGLCGLGLRSDPSRYVLRLRRAREQLDVEVLNDLVLGRALGIDEDKLADHSYVDYTHERDAALALLDTGEVDVACIMNPTPVEAIVARADTGGVMPRKSSFFYPKPLSGIVLYPLDETT